MNSHLSLIEPGTVSHAGMDHSNFEFPTAAIYPAFPNDVVFCGKVITRQTGPGSEPCRPGSSSAEINSGRTNGFTALLRSPSVRENWYRRSGSSRKRYNGMFGTVKFPLQMDLTDIKMRQERREPMPLPKFTKEEDGGESCWELVRPLSRRRTLMSALFRCIRTV